MQTANVINKLPEYCTQAEYENRCMVVRMQGVYIRDAIWNVVKQLPTHKYKSDTYYSYWFTVYGGVDDDVVPQIKQDRRMWVRIESNYKYIYSIGNGHVRMHIFQYHALPLFRYIGYLYMPTSRFWGMPLYDAIWNDEVRKEHHASFYKFEQ